MDVETVLRNAFLFAALAPAQRDRVAAATRSVTLEPGEALFCAEDRAERFFLVVEGHIKLFRVSADGQEKVVNLVGPGETFAEAVMFMDQQSYPVNAAAVTPCRLLSVDNKVFRGVLRDSPETCFRVMADMARRLRVRIGDIDHLTLHSATGRLVGYLVQQAAGSGGGPVDIELAVPKHVLASRLSIQPETLSRILRRLADEGLLRVEGRSVHVPDLERLRARGMAQQPGRGGHPLPPRCR